MSRTRESFGDGVIACAQDISKLLPSLTRRYDATIVVNALAEHVGSALRSLMRRKACDAEQARLVISRIENTAFLSRNGRRTDPPATPENTPPH